MNYFDRFKGLKNEGDSDLDTNTTEEIEQEETLQDLIENHDYEAAGDLCRRLGREEEALRHYDRAIVIWMVNPGEKRYIKPREIAIKARGKEYRSEIYDIGIKMMTSILSIDEVERKEASDYCHKRWNDLWGEKIFTDVD